MKFRKIEERLLKVLEKLEPVPWFSDSQSYFHFSSGISLSSRDSLCHSLLKIFQRRIQHSVSVILQPDFSRKEDSNDFFSLSSLFIQRKVSSSDIHSGQIALPGGRSNDNEPDLSTSLRETWEEVGIDLQNTQEFAHLGRIPQNYFVYMKRGKKAMISVNVFLFKGTKLPQMSLCPREVASAFWVDFDRLYRPSSFLKINYKPFKLEHDVSYFSNRKMENAEKLQMNQSVFGVPLPNQSTLWGVTLLLMAGFAQHYHLEEIKRKETPEFLKLFVEKAIWHELRVFDEKTNKDEEEITKKVYEYALEHRYNQFKLIE